MDLISDVTWRGKTSALVNVVSYMRRTGMSTDEINRRITVTDRPGMLATEVVDGMTQRD